MLKLAIYDSQCGAKVFRATPRLEQVLRQPFVSRWIFDVEILARFLNSWRAEGLNPDGRIYELPLQTWIDVPGSKVKLNDFIRSFTDQCPGSVLAECGRTRVLCTVSVQDQVPPWMVGKPGGWLTAEYAMLPGASAQRKPRDGRTGPCVDRYRDDSIGFGVLGRRSVRRKGRCAQRKSRARKPAEGTDG